MSHTWYEWDVEIVSDDDFEDILDHDFRDTYAEVKAGSSAASGVFTRLVLVRHVETDDAWREDSWAYVEDGKLPEHFEDAYGNKATKVPARFHQEVARHEHP